MRTLLRRFARSDGGTAAVEFALIAPLLVLLTGAVVELGLIVKMYNATDRLAAQYTLAWADCSDDPVGTCLTELATYTTSAAIGNVSPELTNAQVTLQMFQLSMSGTTPTVVYAYPIGATLSAAQTTAAQNTLTDGQAGVLVTATYRHGVTMFTSLMSSRLAAKLQPSYTAVQLKY